MRFIIENHASSRFSLPTLVTIHGNIVAMKVDDTKGATLMPIVSQFVEEGSTNLHDPFGVLSQQVYSSLILISHS
ncbi:MAG: hypothetical protein IJM78_08035 [Prevotella sp.]|nr:hypothetical protein [Prevotella sp.]